ncbi:hypothetical protein DFS34DRAFT_151005 [Phlyctochytrium arcticum]|nr:hypothetical protein DFS34DRAFT_151005 [Phlyctochytrium arcticum]
MGVFALGRGNKDRSDPIAPATPPPTITSAIPEHLEVGPFPSSQSTPPTLTVTAEYGEFTTSTAVMDAVLAYAPSPQRDDSYSLAYTAAMANGKRRPSADSMTSGVTALTANNSAQGPFPIPNGQNHKRGGSGGGSTAGDWSRSNSPSPPHLLPNYPQPQQQQQQQQQDWRIPQQNQQQLPQPQRPVPQAHPARQETPPPHHPTSNPPAHDMLIMHTSHRRTVVSDHNARLIYVTKFGGKTEFPLFGEETTLGRKDDNNIALPCAKISKYHAVIKRGENGYFIRDRNSSNGIKINDKLIPNTPQLLHDSDKLDIGSFTLFFQDEFSSEDGHDDDDERSEGRSPLSPQAGDEDYSAESKHNNEVTVLEDYERRGSNDSAASRRSNSDDKADETIALQSTSVPKTQPSVAMPPRSSTLGPVRKPTATRRSRMSRLSQRMSSIAAANGWDDPNNDWSSVSGSSTRNDRSSGTRGEHRWTNLVTILPSDQKYEESVTIRAELSATSADTDFRKCQDVTDMATLKEDYEKLRLAYELSKVFTTNITEALSKSCELMFEILPVDRAVVLLVDDDTKMLGTHYVKVREGKGYDKKEICLSSTILRKVYHSRKCLITSDAFEDPMLSKQASVKVGQIRSVICVPLIAHSKVLGILHLDSRDRINTFSKKDLSLVLTISTQTAMAIENSLLVKEMQHKARLTENLSRFLPPHVVSKMTSAAKGGMDSIKRGGGRDVVGTILFADIRGFTQLSEKSLPSEVVSLLNDYFERLVRIVFKYSGVVDKYIGDALMAAFGTLEHEGPDAEYRAVCAALEFKEAIDDMNEERAKGGKEAIAVGIGLNTGIYALLPFPCHIYSFSLPFCPQANF